jgi:hypothetical protein
VTDSVGVTDQYVVVANFSPTVLETLTLLDSAFATGWFVINDSQTPSWVDINDAQTPSWSVIPTTIPSS